MIWGPAEDEMLLPQGVRRGDVVILHGKQLGAWALRQDRATLRPEAVEDIAADVARYATYTDDQDVQAPRTVDEWLNDVGKIGLVGLGSLFLIAVTAAAHAVTGLVGAVVVVALSGLALRRGRGRPYALAALTAAVAFLGLVAVSTVLVLLSA